MSSSAASSTYLPSERRFALAERPNLVFGALLGVTAVATLALLAALVRAGSQGAAGAGAVSAGLVSGCIRFALELRHLPPALVLVTLTVVASLAALLRALRALWREQRLLRSLPLVNATAGDARAWLPDAPGVDVHVLRSQRHGAFCAGLLRPRVVVTTALLGALGPDERRAVIAHEAWHARDRAPLKLAFARVVARTLFWVPVLRDLVDRHVLLSEIAADRAAIAATSRAALAGALSEALVQPAFAGGVGLADHAAARIDRLFDADAKLPRLVAPRRVVATLPALGVAAALASSSPRPSHGENAQLHAMSVNLLAHHLGARLVGLALTLVAISLVVTAVRRLRRRRAGSA